MRNILKILPIHPTNIYQALDTVQSQMREGKRPCSPGAYSPETLKHPEPRGQCYTRDISQQMRRRDHLLGKYDAI